MYVLLYSCRSTEWPFYFGSILPFMAVYTMNWIIFCIIMISLCKCSKLIKKRTENSSVENTRSLKKMFVIAMSLTVVLGLGWGFGLAATSSNLVELTFTFQLIFSIFIGSQGVVIFLLHGVRNADFRKVWMKLVLASCRKGSRNTNSVSKRKTSNVQQPKQGFESVILNTLPTMQ